MYRPLKEFTKYRQYIVVETLGSAISCMANPYAYSGKMNQEVLHIYLQVVREDAHLSLWLCTTEEETALLSPGL